MGFRQGLGLQISGARRVHAPFTGFGLGGHGSNLLVVLLN